MRSTALLQRLIALAGAFVIPVFYYWPLFIAPGSFLFSTSGDGLKNYFSFLYQERWGDSFVHFHGMNYPFGELHLFTDGQPAMLQLYRWLQMIFPELDPIAFMNGAMLWSIPISYFFLFLIFRKFKLDILVAALGALCLTFLAPQVFRFNGHFGLAYFCAIPMIWYFILQMRSKLKWLWALFSLVSILFFFFVHPYLGLILSIFVLFEGMAYALFQKKGRVRSLILAGLVSLTPVVLFFLFTSSFDHHPNRTPDPYGIFTYHAKPNTVFLPNHAPLKPLVEKAVTIVNQTWEGWAYIGLGGLIFCVFGLIRIFRRMRKKRTWKPLNPSLPKNLRSAFWASVVLLLFSMAIPLEWGLDFMLDLLPPLKQFRSLGRFAWIFYYVIGVYAFYILSLIWRLLIIRNKSILAYSLLIAFGVLYFWEGSVYHVEQGVAMNNDVALLDSYDFKEIDAADYQAVIPMPFFHHGSENFELAGSDASRKLAFLFSMKTSIPILGGSMARTSVPESKKIIQLFGPNHFPKEIKKDLSDSRPFLLLFSLESLPKEEMPWIQKSSLIAKTDDYELREIRTSSFLKEEKTPFAADSSFVKWKDKKVFANGPFYFFDYDTLKSEQSQFGASAFSGKIKNYVRPIVLKRAEFEGWKDIRFSMWMFNAGFSRTQQEVFAEGIDAEGGTQRIAGGSVMRSRNIWGDWSFVEIEGEIKPEYEEVRLVTKGSRWSRLNYYLDNLLVRPTNVSVQMQGFETEDGDEIGMKDGYFFQMKNVAWPIPDSSLVSPLPQ